MYPKDYLYTREHEWVCVKDNTALIGITSFATNELGEVVFVELPLVDQTFTENDAIGTVESVKAVSEIFAPISGTVLEVNQEVIDAPEILNEDPHSEGWLVKMTIANEKELKVLMSAEEYDDYTKAGRE